MLSLNIILTFIINEKKVEKVVNEFKLELENLYGDNLVSVIIYGSQARGDAKKNSYIDILVILNNMSSPFFEIDKIVDIIHEHLLKDNELIQVIPTSAYKFNDDINSLYSNIKKEGLKIY